MPGDVSYRFTHEGVENPGLCGETHKARLFTASEKPMKKTGDRRFDGEVLLGLAWEDGNASYRECHSTTAGRDRKCRWTTKCSLSPRFDVVVWPLAFARRRDKSEGVRR